MWRAPLAGRTGVRAGLLPCLGEGAVCAETSTRRSTLPARRPAPQGTVCSFIVGQLLKQFLDGIGTMAAATNRNTHSNAAVTTLLHVSPEQTWIGTTPVGLLVGTTFHWLAPQTNPGAEPAYRT